MAANRNPAIVRLFPIATEHTTPLVLDLVFLFAAYAVWTAAIGRVYGGPVFAVIALTVLFHVAQVWWLVVDRFDDTGVTIIRPWRRRHVPWKQISGLVYTQARSSGRGVTYQLRLVLADNEPPLGRHLSGAERQAYATGPVVMSLNDLEQDLHRGDDDREVRCAQRVFDELARHGFPKPPPHTLGFRLARFTTEEINRAAAIDMLKQHPVTVTHGPLDDEGTRRLDTEVADLAREWGPTREIYREPGYAVYSFETAQAADAFLAAARLVLPARWPVTAGALPA